MSWNPAIEPICPDAGQLDAIETLIVPRARAIGGFEVRRALPSSRRQMVGPFIFFDIWARPSSSPMAVSKCVRTRISASRP